jgi:poly(hydroxyalkanoate) depolymerase family esterase
MPRRRTGARALKSWTSAMRAALRLAGTVSAANRRLATAIGTAPTKTKPAAKKIVAKAGKRGATKRCVAKSGTTTSSATTRGAKPIGASCNRTVTPATASAQNRPAVAATLPAGAMETGRFRNASGARAYRLYRPNTLPAAGTRPPLVVMLHGCAQDAESFAATTRMPAEAEAYGCWVLYPEQSVSANRHRCWNWFDPAHQRRGVGEPAILAGLVRKLIRVHGLDAGRIFVAGLSAGGALAVVLGRTYPDLFRGVGACAGMPYAAARTATTAVLALRGRHRPAHETDDATGAAVRPLRTVVIHGERDRIVVPRNADALAAQALQSFGATAADSESGVSGGRAFTRVRHRTAEGRVVVEQWKVASAGHAWPGGAAGAFSDPLGPDASAILLRFFFGAPANGIDHRLAAAGSIGSEI